MLLPNRCIALGLIAITAAACGDGDASTVDATAAVADAASPLPGITFYDYAIAVDVSPDGNAAVFEDLSTAEVLLVTVNTATGALGTPVDAGDPSLDVATGVANGGRISAVHGNPAQAGIYDPTAAAWQDLASPYATDCDPNAGGSFDINGDGSVAVGLMWNGCSPVAFRWPRQVNRCRSTRCPERVSLDKRGRVRAGRYVWLRWLRVHADRRHGDSAPPRCVAT